MRNLLSFACLLSIPLACKTSADQSRSQDYLVHHGEQRRIYFLDQGLIKTGLCKGNLPVIDAEIQPSRIKELCQEQVSAGVTVEAFRTAMIDLFKKTYKASELSTYERVSLETVITQIVDQKTVREGYEADKKSAAANEIDSIWLQFMPFAAGALTSEVATAAFEPVKGSLMRERDITVGDEQAEYVMEGADFQSEVNLFTVYAISSDKKTLCPAYVDVLSVSNVVDGMPVPAFGGDVVGGSRFLLNDPTVKIANMRFSISAEPSSPLYKAGMSCTLAVFATKVDPVQLGYDIKVPKAIALDARDQKMAELMAKPEVRAWHFLWHGIRNAWDRFSVEEKKEIVDKLGPAWSLDTGGTGDPKEKGEEFLQMHHTMLEALRTYLGPDMYDAWPAPPPPNDSRYGVPSYGDPAQKVFIDATCNTLMDLHRQATDGALLKKVSLSTYGLWLERSMHNMMHTTWSHPTQWFHSYEPTLQEIMSQPNKYPSYNHPSNNSLSGTYTSHVNPFFYRLHGYIDARIQDWLKAHGYKTISKSCAASDKTCYQWKRTWDGTLPASVTDLTKAHEHGIDPSKIGEISEGIFREVAKNSQMIPALGTPTTLK